MKRPVLPLRIFFLMLMLFSLNNTAELQAKELTKAKNTLVPQYRLFEASVSNTKAYQNRFTDVELLVSYQSPSGRSLEFRGFFDGDGKGGGNAQNGKIWKMRFMPDEAGIWQYEYRWSDDSPGGKGSFNCTAEGAGKVCFKPTKRILTGLLTTAPNPCI